jgi:hypothetical protein
MNGVEDVRWWLDRHAESRARLVFEALTKIRKRDSARRRRLVRHACLYGDGGLDGLGGLVSSMGPPDLQFNVVRRTVDTCTAKIAKARPLPMALTSGGDFRQRRRAQRLSRFFAGMFDELEVFETSELIARDALIFGAGVTRHYRVDDEIHSARVLPWELDVDQLDARYGKPRTIYLHYWMDRLVMRERFGAEHERAILDARNDGFDDDPMHADSGRDDDFVVVTEAWRLPCGETPGRHVIAVNAEDGVLLDEDYARKSLPFSVLRYSPHLLGFWGDGFASLLEGMQWELNSIARKVQESQYLMGNYIFVEDGSGIETDHLDNGVGTIVRFRGTPPTFMSPNANSQQTMDYMAQLRGAWAYEETGTSALSARSEKPAGIDSAVGLRTFNDIESERFVLFGKAYERYHVDVAWQLYELASEAKRFTVRATSRGKNLEKIDFKEVKLDRDEFTLRVFPTSALSNDPAARRAEVNEYVTSGLIPPEVARGLLELPDLEEYNATADAPRRCIEDIVWRILDADLDTDDEELRQEREDEAYTYPEPTFDLQLCVQLGSQHYLRARLDRAPQENLDLLMRFITDAQSQLAAAQPPAPPPMAPPDQQPMPPVAA